MFDTALLARCPGRVELGLFSWLEREKYHVNPQNSPSFLVVLLELTTWQSTLLQKNTLGYFYFPPSTGKSSPERDFWGKARDHL